MEQEVILVDEHDQATGTAGKMKAHEEGWLHRAFSVFIFDSRGRMLLQQRAGGKYHGAHLWTNACCSHPHPDEDTEAAAARRLQEEMGFVTPLEPLFSFTYRAEVENGLTEHEFDHVFAGEYEGTIAPDKHEVEGYRYEEMRFIEQQLEQHPEKFTAWFRIVFPRIKSWCQDRYRPSAKS